MFHDERLFGRSRVNQHLDISRDDVKSVQNLFQVLLGRWPLSAHEVMHFSRQSIPEVICGIAAKQEFRDTVKIPLEITGFAAPGRFTGQPTHRLTDWLVKNLSLKKKTGEALKSSNSWREVLQNLWSDEGFSNRALNDTFGDKDLKKLREGLSITSPRVPLPNGVHPQILPGKAIFIDTQKALRPYVRKNTIDLRRRLRPANAIRVTRGQYVAQKNDPQLMLQHTLEPGTYILSIEARYSTPSGDVLPREAVKLYLNFDGTFSEEDTVCLSVSDGLLKVDGLLEVVKGINFIRFDPSDYPCNFRILCFELSPLEFKS